MFFSVNLSLFQYMVSSNTIKCPSDCNMPHWFSLPNEYTLCSFIKYLFKLCSLDCASVVLFYMILDPFRIVNMFWITEVMKSTIVNNLCYVKFRINLFSIHVVCDIRVKTRIFSLYCCQNLYVLDRQILDSTNQDCMFWIDKF